jgi:hypothetical protein
VIFLPILGYGHSAFGENILRSMVFFRQLNQPAMASLRALRKTGWAGKKKLIGFDSTCLLLLAGKLTSGTRLTLQGHDSVRA